MVPGRDPHSGGTSHTMKGSGVWVSGAAVLVALGSLPASAAGPQPPCAQDPGNCQLPDQLGHGDNQAIGAFSDLNPNAGFTAADNFVSTSLG